MPSADKQGLDDQVLSRYLLGALPVEETEPLDELSIADEEFAMRLDSVENDLVDAYARGDLFGDALEQFQKFYLSSPRGREKVEFARTLQHFGEKTGSAAAGAAKRSAVPDIFQSRSLRRWFTLPRFDLNWGFAAAAMTFLLAGTYLFVENERLQKQATDSRNQQVTLNQHAQELEKQLGEQRAVNDGMLKELERLRESAAGPRALKIVTALLLPQTRGIGQIPTVSMPQGTDQVHLRLQLETDDFPAYQVGLKDAAGRRVIWHKPNVKARAEGGAKIVSINIPAGLLKPQNYVLELRGVSSNGRTEFISGYPMRVARK